METQESNKIFSDIDNLYAKYLEVSLKKDDAAFKEKYAVALKSVRDKLIIAVCKLYFKFENKVGSSKNISPVTARNKNNDNYSDIVVIETINAMDTYTDNGYSFSQYVCMKINSAKGKEQSRKIASYNHGGSSISEYEAQQIRQVMKKDKELLKFGIYDENKRNEKLSRLLSTDFHPMSVESIVHFKQLGSCQTTGIEGKNSDGELYSVIDQEKNLTEKHFVTPESEALRAEFKAQINKLFLEIDKIYREKNDKRESEILTISLLKPFQIQKEEFNKNSNSLKTFNLDLYILLSQYGCIDKSILQSFFEDPDYILPTQSDIEKKYGLKDKYTGKLLQRFRESIAENGAVKDYFYDFIKKK